MNLSALVNWIAVNHNSVLALVGGAGGLSIVLEVILSKFHINSKKLAFTLLNVVTILTSLSTYLMGASGKQAAGTFAGLTVLAQFWHRFVVSDANAKYVTPFLEYLSNQKTTNQKTTNQTSSAIVGVVTQSDLSASMAYVTPASSPADMTTVGK